MSRKSRRTHSQLAKSETFHSFNGGPIEEGAGHRQARLEHILLNELQSVLTDEAADPKLEGIKLLAVHLSADGGHARVAYAVLSALSDEQRFGRASLQALARARGFLRARLSQQLDLKKTPNLSFTFVGISPAVPDHLLSPSLSTRALEKARERLAPKHLGTLGGGNHFIELDRDGGGDLWLLVHSGSRWGSAVLAEPQDIWALFCDWSLAPNSPRTTAAMANGVPMRSS